MVVNKNSAHPHFHLFKNSCLYSIFVTHVKLVYSFHSSLKMLRPEVDYGECDDEVILTGSGF